jgi:hypothetical protein
MLSQLQPSMDRVVLYGSDPITLESQPRCLEYRLPHPHHFCATYDPYQQGSSDEIELGHARRPSRKTPRITETALRLDKDEHQYSTIP